MVRAGAVARMAGQDFREILSVGCVMRDSGIQAQDAGTSIKAALMALMAPSNEARDTLEALNIQVYDASGQMKAWSGIVSEFEKALGPLNDQSKQLVLGTVFGSDGIRAMSASLNKGSGYLREFTEGLKHAEGATHKMATAMADTFDGAVRKVNASLERAKILMFEDFASGAVNILNVINTMIIGFTR
jgi:TP901 family phage tail tape measure protein